MATARSTGLVDQGIGRRERRRIRLASTNAGRAVEGTTAPNEFAARMWRAVRLSHAMLGPREEARSGVGDLLEGPGSSYLSP